MPLIKQRLIGTRMSSLDMCKNFWVKWNFNHSWIFNHHFCKISCQTSKVHGNLKLKLIAQKKELWVGWAFAYAGPRDASSWKAGWNRNHRMRSKKDFRILNASAEPGQLCGILSSGWDHKKRWRIGLMKLFMALMLLDAEAWTRFKSQLENFCVAFLCKAERSCLSFSLPTSWKQRIDSLSLMEGLLFSLIEFKIVPSTKYWDACLCTLNPYSWSAAISMVFFLAPIEALGI